MDSNILADMEEMDSYHIKEEDNRFVYEDDIEDDDIPMSWIDIDLERDVHLSGKITGRLGDFDNNLSQDYKHDLLQHILLYLHFRKCTLFIARVGGIWGFLLKNNNTPSHLGFMNKMVLHFKGYVKMTPPPFIICLIFYFYTPC